MSRACSKQSRCGSQLHFKAADVVQRCPMDRLAHTRPLGVRPRPGLRPKHPVEAEGTRIEPPPSLAPPAATMPTLTTAAAPPLEPRGVNSRFHGARVGPQAFGSVIPSGTARRRASSNACVGLGRCIASARSRSRHAKRPECLTTVAVLIAAAGECVAENRRAGAATIRLHRRQASRADELF